MDLENKDADGRKKMGGSLIHIGRFIAFIAAAFMIVMLVSEGALKDISTGDMAGILLIVLGAIALAAYVISFWKANYAGILLIAVSLAFVMHSFYYLSNGQIALWMLTGMPQLVAGSLLLIGWGIKKTG